MPLKTSVVNVLIMDKEQLNKIRFDRHMYLTLTQFETIREIEKDLDKTIQLFNSMEDIFNLWIDLLGIDKMNSKKICRNQIESLRVLLFGIKEEE